MVRTPVSVDISISNNLEVDPGDIQNQFILKSPEILGKYKKMRIRTTGYNCLTAKSVAVGAFGIQSRKDPIDEPLTSFCLHSPHHCVAQLERPILVLYAVCLAMVARIISLNSLLSALAYARLSFQWCGLCSSFMKLQHIWGVGPETDNFINLWEHPIKTAAVTDNGLFIPGGLYNQSYVGFKKIQSKVLLTIYLSSKSPQGSSQCFQIQNS